MFKADALISSDFPLPGTTVSETVVQVVPEVAVAVNYREELVTAMDEDPVCCC